MSARRRGTLTLGIVLCAAGALVAAAPSAGTLFGWLERGWPAILVVIGGVRLAGFAVRRRPASPVSGALLLAGGLLLLAFTLWSAGGLLEFYGRWWPLVIGVVALVEVLRHYTRRPDLGERPTLVTGGKLLLVLAIATTGLVAQRVAAMNPNILASVELPGPLASLRDNLFGEEYAFDAVTQTADLPSGAVVEVTNRFGALEVTGADGDRVEVRLVPRVRAYDREAAAEVAGRLRLAISAADSVLTVGTNREEIDREIVTDMEVRVPRHAEVRVEHGHGRVTIVGLEPQSGELRVHAAHAPIEIRGVRAAVDVENNHGSLTVRASSGSLRVDAPYTDVTVANFDGPVELQNVDDVELADVSGDRVRLTDIHHARAELRRITAPEVNLSGTHMDLDLAFVEGAVMISTSHADVKAVDIAGPLTVQATHTEVDVLRAGAVRIATSHDDVTVTDASGPQEVENSHGGIRVRLTRGPQYRVWTEVDHGEARVDRKIAADGAPDAIPVTLRTNFDDIVVEQSATSRRGGAV
jgi:hypothetical protein